jgi:hypothetical protein
MKNSRTDVLVAALAFMACFAVAPRTLAQPIANKDVYVLANQLADD